MVRLIDRAGILFLLGGREQVVDALSKTRTLIHSPQFNYIASFSDRCAKVHARFGSSDSCERHRRGRSWRIQYCDRHQRYGLGVLNTASVTNDIGSGVLTTASATSNVNLVYSPVSIGSDPNSLLQASPLMVYCSHYCKRTLSCEHHQR